MKVFLTLTCAGMLLAGLGFGTLIEGTDEPVRQTVLFAMGIWLTLVGIVRFGKEPWLTTNTAPQLRGRSWRGS
jgi:hypothetical protein